MEWLNLNIADLDSAAFVGANPTERGTWLCLLRFCVGQENGGRILECANWGDAKWQQMCRVKLKEVRAETDLWYWEEFNLVVNFYPKKQERIAKKNRKNGHKGGRPKEKQHNQSVNHSNNPNEGNRVNVRKGEEEGKSNSKSKGKEVGKPTANSGQLSEVRPTTSFHPDPSHGSRQLVDGILKRFSDPGAALGDVLQFFKVRTEIDGEPINHEWVKDTRGQALVEVAMIFFSVPRGTASLPSLYRKARDSFRFMERQSA